MPRNPAASTVDSIERVAGEHKPLRAHDGREGRNSSFQRQLNLSFVFILWGKRHGKYVPIVQVTSKTGHTTAYIQQDTGMLSPPNSWVDLTETQPTTGSADLRYKQIPRGFADKFYLIRSTEAHHELLLCVELQSETPILNWCKQDLGPKCTAPSAPSQYSVQHHA